MSTYIKHQKINSWLWTAVVAGFVLCIYRLLSLFETPVALHVDEAQYLDWSRSLAAGYYSKPPFIAWIIAGNNVICSKLEISQIEGCTRLTQPIAIFFTSFFITATTWLISRNKLAATWACLVVSTLPFIGFYSLFATTDAWLLMFWSMALYFSILAIQQSKWQLIYWGLVGIAIGLGLLTKYSMAALLLSGLIWLIINKRFFAFGPWFAVVISTLIFIPNIQWNISTDFPTLSHHIEIAQISVDNQVFRDLNARMFSFSGFLISQVIVAGPHVIFFLGLQAFRFSKYGFSGSFKLRADNDLALSLLRCATWLLLLLAGMQAFSSRAFANWAVPAYLSASILLAVELSKKNLGYRTKKYFRRLVLGSIIFGFILALTLIHLPSVAYYSGDIFGYKIRAVEKLRGWKELAFWVRKEATTRRWIVVSDDRRILAAVAAYGYPDVRTIFAWNPDCKTDSHYHWFYSLHRQQFEVGQRFLLIRLDSQISRNDFLEELEFYGRGSTPSCETSVKYKFIREIILAPPIDSLELGGQRGRVRAYELVIL